MINNKTDREQQKNKGVSLREAGELQSALEIFQEVEEWDEQNNNPNGQIDVLGHIRITYTRLGEEKSLSDQKEEMYLKAQSVLNKALKIVGDSDAGRKAILKVHLAGVTRSIASLKEGNEKRDLLLESLEFVTDGFEDLPGTVAHKAWPLNVQAKIFFDLNREEEAFEAVALGEKCIFQGYKDHMDSSDNSEQEIKIWLTGLYLTLAKHFLEQKENILATFYTNAVLSLEDSQNLLGERKKEAKRISDNL